jgi:hypothetical protein
MSGKKILEFYPEIVIEIPENPGGSCCLKPIVTQSKISKKMYLFAQHLKWKYKDRINLEIPTKSDSRILLVRKYKQFVADLRKKRLGISKLPALVISDRILCEGKIGDEIQIEQLINKILNKNILMVQNDPKQA